MELCVHICENVLTMLPTNNVCYTAIDNTLALNCINHIKYNYYYHYDIFSDTGLLMC